MAEFEADVPDCLFKERWWDEVKDRGVVHWNIIGGGIYKVELCIELGKERKYG